MGVIQKCWREYGIFNVRKLWKLTDNEETRRIPIEDVKHNLNKKHWFLLDGLHRLSKLVKNKRKTIKIKYITSEMLRKAVNFNYFFCSISNSEGVIVQRCNNLVNCSLLFTFFSSD